MNRRDLLLNEMNIAQWVLAKPQVLKGDAQIRLAETVRLVVICEQDRQQSQLFKDILRTLNLQPSQYQWLNFEQAMRLSFSHSPLFWLIQDEPQAVTFRQKFAKNSQKLLANPSKDLLAPSEPLAEPTFKTQERFVTACQHSSWEQLHQPAVKRQFWRQIEPLCPHFEEI